MDFSTKKSKVFFLIPILFIVLTFFYSINRIPFFDEAHSFLISQLKINQIFYMTRIEGHPFLWYLLVKLFTFKTSFYPYPMLILNWVISSVMILFFWFRFPFNTIEKTLVIFSYPFFAYFSTVARPYALTVLSIFLLAYFLNKNRPILYAFLLLFALNTSVMGMMSAICFFCLFVYTLAKEKNITKKQILVISFIFLFEILFFIAQFYLTVKPGMNDNNILVNDFKREFYSYIFNPFLKFNADTLVKVLFKSVTFCLVWSSVVLFYKKSKKALFYFIFSNLLITFVFLNVYIGATWHYYFYFVNFIVSISMCYNEVINYKFYKILFLIFLILLLNPYSILKNGKIYALNTSYYPAIQKNILDFKQSHEGKYFCFDFYGSVVGVLPYLKNNGVEIYNIKGYERTSFSALVSTMELRNVVLLPDTLYSVVSKTENNYLLATMSNLNKDKDYPNEKIYKNDKCILKFKLEFADKNSQFAIYKIEAKCNE